MDDVVSEIHANERSEGGELISYMNVLFQQNNWHFKKAVGELSLSSNNANDGRNKTLFPDIIIFKDSKKLLPLMGWELKMPDVSINDEEFYENAKDKANRMGTSAFVLWNFKSCRVFYKKAKQWSKRPDREYNGFSDILVDRKSVHENETLWQKKLFEILIDLNEDLINKLYKVAPIKFNIGGYVSTISSQLTPITSEYLLTIKDPLLRIRMKNFVQEEQAELEEVNIKTINGPKGLKVAADAYSKNIIIRWINRILFCNLIRKNHNILSDVLYKFIKDKNIISLKNNINSSIAKTDFYSILHVENDEVLLPDNVINNLAEFCNYLWSVGWKSIDDNFISQVLESIVNSTKRELMGLYTTPQQLAKLLVKLSIRNVEGSFADFTVGSGTIIKELISELREFNSIQDIHNQVWAADKYLYPLQVANLNMTSSDSLDLKNIIFKHNVLTLSPGETVSITNPSTGLVEQLKVPMFSTIISNLPFISSNKLSSDDKKILQRYGLNGKHDLYQGIILHYRDLLEKSDNSRIGVITSNSWFKNQKRTSFFETLLNNFDIKQIVYSNVARWFNNAKVVATILILSPKSNNQDKIQFIGLNKDIRNESLDFISNLADKIIIGKKSEDFKVYEYKPQEVIKLLKTGICLEALFDDISWYEEVLKKNILKPLNEICDVQRGTRTGADRLFITDGLKTDTQDSHLYIKNLKEITSYVIKPSNQYFFYTNLSIDSLRKEKHNKTLNYIEYISRKEDAIRMRKKHGDGWYIAEDKPKYGDFVTSINPDKRLFWATFEQRTALNQRIVAASLKPEYVDKKDLIHALLNSVISLFVLCGSGFARAEGVTDITKDGLERLEIPNPDLLSKKESEEILNSWKLVSGKKITNILDQLKDTDWKNFNENVLKAYGLDPGLYNDIAGSIVTLINRRNNISKS